MRNMREDTKETKAKKLTKHEAELVYKTIVGTLEAIGALVEAAHAHVLEDHTETKEEIAGANIMFDEIMCNLEDMGPVSVEEVQEKVRG